VEIVLSTHEAGGLSARDITLAKAIDALLPG
jgi:pterin-4a-carbinolamine dehydratase